MNGESIIIWADCQVWNFAQKMFETGASVISMRFVQRPIEDSPCSSSLNKRVLQFTKHSAKKIIVVLNQESLPSILVEISRFLNP